MHILIKFSFYIESYCYIHNILATDLSGIYGEIQLDSAATYWSSLTYIMSELRIGILLLINEIITIVLLFHRCWPANLERNSRVNVISNRYTRPCTCIFSNIQIDFVHLFLQNLFDLLVPPRPLHRPDRSIIVDPQSRRKSRAISRVAMTLSQYRKASEDSRRKIKDDSGKFMGLFVNPQDLPAAIEGGSEESTESSAAIESQHRKTKRQTPKGAPSGVYTARLKTGGFLQNLRLQEDDPLAGMLFWE